MAQPITFRPIQNGAAPIGAGLPAAAGEHADAVQSAYELLQLLHDRGVLDLLRGLLGAGDQLIDTLVEAVDTPESIRAIRNLLVLTKVLGSIPPETLTGLVQAATEGAVREKSRKAPGFFELFRRLRSEDSRRALGVTLDLVESVGKSL
ncbi:MAG: hypothetical protein JWO80_4730 [Bryobacterales bacterium]|nr:hypothetical protein [Bryobacterales bacterium]